MRRLMSVTLTAALCSAGFLGCSDTSKVESTKTISTPNGKTEVTSETTVKKSGDAPPPATAP